MVFKYNVCFEECMDLSPRSVNGTTLEETEPIRRTNRSGSQKK